MRQPLCRVQLLQSRTEVSNVMVKEREAGGGGGEEEAAIGHRELDTDEDAMWILSFHLVL